MSRKKDAEPTLTAAEAAQVQQLLAQVHQTAATLHTASTAEQVEAALDAINHAAEAVQLALLKAVVRQHHTDAADVLSAINELGANKNVRKEAKRALIRLEGEKVYPQWKPPLLPPPVLQSAVAHSPRFWQGLVTRAREEGEVQLILTWEYGIDYNEVRMMTFLLDFWEQGLKDFLIEENNKHAIETRLQQLQAKMSDVTFDQLTLAEARRLLEEALSVNAWRGTTPVKEYRHHQLAVKQYILDAKDGGADRHQTFINPNLEPDEVAATFIAAWSLGDFGAAYDLLANNSAPRGDLPRSEWITQRRQWANEAKPTRFEVSLVREREVKSSAIWVPSLFGAAAPSTRREFDTCWSLEVRDTPLSGTLEEMPLGTIVNKETGRHWFWTSYTMLQEHGAWRIRSISDQGANAQALSLNDLQQRLEEHKERINQILQMPKSPGPELQPMVDELAWRTIQTLHYDDALIVHLPLDRDIYGDAANRSLGMGLNERAMAYLERMANKFAEARGVVLRQLAIVEETLAEHYAQRKMQERSLRFFTLAEQTMRQALEIDPSMASHALLGEMLIRHQEHLDEAETHLLRAKALAANVSEETHLEADLGDLALSREHFTQALSHYQRVLEQDPNFHDIWTKIGVSYRNLQQFEDAKLAFQQGIAANPEDFAPYGELTDMFISIGQNQQARQLLEESAQQHPQAATPLAMLASIYLQMGDRRRALETLQAAERIDPRLEIVQLVHDTLNQPAQR